MRKSISFLLSIVMVLSIFSCLTVSVSAATVYETEDNDSVSTADSIRFADVMVGNLSDSYDEDYYSFYVSQKGYININITNSYNSSGYWSVYVYKYDGGFTDVYNQYVYRNVTSHDFAKIGVEPGTYVVYIDFGSNVTGVEYKLTVNHVATQTWECELNDEVNTANQISLGYTYGGSLRDSYDEDYYTFYVSQKGYLNINISNTYNSSGYWSVYIYKYDNGLTDIYNQYVYRNVTSHDFAKIGVEPGTYILDIDYGSNVTDVEYNFTVNHIATQTWESEHNDEVNSANAISLGYTYGGSLRDSYDSDYYTFTVNTPGYLGVSFNTEYASSGYFCVYLYKFTTYLDEVSYEYLYRNDCGGSLESVYVEPGTYFVEVDYGSNVTDVEYYLTCNLYDSTPTLSNINGTWYCLVYGQIDWGYTGLVDYNGAYYYVENGAVNWNYTGLVYHYGSYYYVSGGVLDWGYTGLAYHYGSYYYVNGGILDWSYTGLAYYYGAYYYVSGGVLDWGYTGLAYYYGDYYYVSGGVLNWNYTGLVEYYGGWYYVSNGYLDWSVTTLTYYYGTWYYVENGAINWNSNTLVYYDGGWYYALNGTVAWYYNGYVWYGGARYYITNGYLDWSRQW